MPGMKKCLIQKTWILFSLRFRKSLRCGSFGTWSSKRRPLKLRNAHGWQALIWKGSYLPLYLTVTPVSVVSANVSLFLLINICNICAGTTCTVTDTWTKDLHKTGLGKNVCLKEMTERRGTGRESSMNLRPMIQTGKPPRLAPCYGHFTFSHIN